MSCKREALGGGETEELRETKLNSPYNRCEREGKREWRWEGVRYMNLSCDVEDIKRI